MTVAFTSGTATSGKLGTGTTITFTSFAVSGTNPLILVKVALADLAGSIVSIVCSAGLTSGTPVEVKTAQGTDISIGTFVSVWAIPAPAGTGTITVTLGHSVPWQAVAELWANADQTTPCPAADAGAATGDTNPLSITPTNLTADDAASGIGANGSAGDSPDFDQTETYKDNTSAVNMSAGYHLGTGAVSCTWGSPHPVDAFVGARIVAAAAGGVATAIVNVNQVLRPFNMAQGRR